MFNLQYRQRPSLKMATTLEFLVDWILHGPTHEKQKQNPFNLKTPSICKRKCNLNGNVVAI